MKKRILILLILAALVGGVYYAALYVQENKQEADGSLTLYGNVDIRSVALGFRVAGRIEHMCFEEGDRVQQGAVLARLDDVPFREDLALARARLAEVEAVLRNAETLYSRRENLVRTGAVSRGAYDEALAARDEGRAKLETAKAALAQSLTRLDDTAIRAPADGTLLTRVREPGAIVASGATVYTLALDSPVWVRAYIDEPNLGHVRPGQKARVFTDSGGTYAAQVGFISPQAEFTPKTVETKQLRTDLVYRLRIVVDAPDQGLRQGMPVTVVLEKHAAPS